MELRGTVVRERVGAGTKSERDAILLVTEDGRRLQLRVKGGNPLYDPNLEPFIGRIVRVEGTVAGALMIAESAPEPV